MLKLVLLITPRIDAGHQIGEAWQRVGATGVTYAESHGLYRLQEAAQHHELLPGTSSLLSILRQNEQNNIMIFSVVDAALVDDILDATESVTGDISKPHNGVMFVLPVEQAFGLRE